MRVVAASGPDAAATERSADYRIVALVVSTSLFMQYLDSSALVTALPSMARGFGVSPTTITVVLTAYLVSLALFIPLGGLLAEHFGARRMFRIALGLFLAGALACAFAPSLPLLICARIVQGAGGAILLPVGRLIVVRSSRPSELLSAMNWLMIPTIVGPMLGPLVGGVLTTMASWRWIFALHVPVAVTGLLLSGVFIPPIRGEASPGFDGRGMLLVGGALVLLVFGIQSLSHSPSTPRDGLLLVAGSFLSGGLYVVHSRRHPKPLLDLSLLALPTFRISMESGAFLRVASAASGFLVPMLFQLGFGLSAAQSGAITFAAVAGGLLSRWLGVPIVRRFAIRKVTLGAITASAAAMATTALVGPHWPIWALWGLLGAGGFFQSVAFVVLGSIAYVDVEPARVAAATAFYTTIQQMTMSLGVSLGVLLLAVQQWMSAAPVPQPQHFAHAFVALAAVLLAGMAAGMRFHPEAGAALRAGANR